MLTIDELVARVKPTRTVLFLGAGASIPSGCPSGSLLAKELEDKLNGGRRHSDDLTEVCSILELKYGRRNLVDTIKAILTKHTPTGGLLVLSELDWPVIYTTNFDTLIEQAYRHCKRPCNPIRSNYDYSNIESEPGTPLFKIHGCVTSDRAWGHLASMILTEEDYEQLQQYRQMLFRRLNVDLVGNKDILIIGHSLSDPHLKKAMQEAVKIQREAGFPGRLFALLYTKDLDRARLFENRGYEVAFGSIDEFMQKLSEAMVAETPPLRVTVEPTDRLTLPITLLACTLEVANAATSGRSNFRKLFQGSPATYPDIRENLTFARKAEGPLIDFLVNQNGLAVTITGAAGVGKTTMARRLAYSLSEQGYTVWEHKLDFPFRSADWLNFVASYAPSERRAVLLINDCTDFQRDVNALINGLKLWKDIPLHLILTAQTHEWNPRQKSPRLYSHGKIEHLSRLEFEDIRALLRLVHQNREIMELIDIKFRSKPVGEQRELPPIVWTVPRVE